MNNSNNQNTHMDLNSMYNTGQTSTPYTPQPAPQTQQPQQKPPKKKRKGHGLFFLLLTLIIAGGFVYVNKESIFKSTKKSNNKNYTESSKIVTWKVDKDDEEEDDCIDKETTIYETDEYIYTVPNSCVAKYKIVYSDDKEFTIKEVLEKKKITVEELNKQGVKVTKKAKATSWNIDKGTEDNCAQQIITIYETEDTVYTVSNSCIANYKVVFTNGESYTLSNALATKIVTVEDLISKGVAINKEPRVITWTIDKGEQGYCTQQMFKIYEDASYDYTVANNCIANYKVAFSTGEKYSLNEALTKRKVTIDELINSGVEIYKTAKQLTWTIDKGEGKACSQVITKIYEDETNEYTVPDTCVASYKVVYSNGETYSLKQALEAKKVTITELTNKGVKIYISKK